jgi:hypothetical protein
MVNGGDNRRCIRITGTLSWTSPVEEIPSADLQPRLYQRKKPAETLFGVYQPTYQPLNASIVSNADMFQALATCIPFSVSVGMVRHCTCTGQAGGFT